MQNKSMNEIGRWVAVIVLVLVAVFGIYRFASARNGGGITQATTEGANGAAGAVPAVNSNAQGSGSSACASSGADGSGAGCACCSGSGAASATPTEGTAKLSGGVQTISVDLSTGTYKPDTIRLKAGVPAEITFGQSSGCTAVVQSKQLGFHEDLTSGPKTVKLDGLPAGTYSFSCGMEMVFGKIVVQ
jgi:hypothetical protein